MKACRRTNESWPASWDLVKESVEGGAVGFSTSRFLGHRVPDGRLTPGTWADPRETQAIQQAVVEAGGARRFVPSGAGHAHALRSGTRHVRTRCRSRLPGAVLRRHRRRWRWRRIALGGLPRPQQRRWPPHHLHLPHSAKRLLLRPGAAGIPAHAGLARTHEAANHRRSRGSPQGPRHPRQAGNGGQGGWRLRPSGADSPSDGHGRIPRLRLGEQEEPAKARRRRRPRPGGLVH